MWKMCGILKGLNVCKDGSLHCVSSCSSTSHDWQRDGLLDNCGDDEAASSEVDAAHQQQHSDQQQPRPWWQLSSANSLWKQRLRQSIESLRHFRWHPPTEYSINDDEGGGHQSRPLRPRSSSKSSSSIATKDWPLSSLDGSNVEGRSLRHHETDLEQQSYSHIHRPHIRHWYSNFVYCISMEAVEA